MNAFLALTILSIVYPSWESVKAPGPIRSLFPEPAAPARPGAPRKLTVPPPRPACVSTRLCTGADGRTALLVRSDTQKPCNLPTLLEDFGRSLATRPSSPVKAGKLAGTAGGRVAINTASLAELESLPGVGPGRARRIIEARSREPFKKLGDLRRIPGFGAKTLQRLRDLVEF